MKQFWDVVQTNTVNNAIDLVTDLYHLAGTVVSAINTIQYRIQQIYGNVDYEMAVLLNPTRKAYFLNYSLPNVSFVHNENFPEDAIFVLCKSVGSERVIKPADNVDWSEYWQKIIGYVMKESNDMPILKLEITKPYLQARIRIKDETTA